MISIRISLTARNDALLARSQQVQRAGFQAVCSEDTVLVYKNGCEVAHVNSAGNIHTLAGHLAVRGQLKPHLTSEEN